LPNGNDVVERDGKQVHPIAVVERYEFNVGRIQASVAVTGVVLPVEGYLVGESCFRKTLLVGSDLDFFLLVGLTLRSVLLEQP